MELAVDEKRQELVERAKEAYNKAYAPYSHYPVGAAVLFNSGKIYSGCNVENASFGLTSCAERNAIFAGIVEGERKIVEVAIAVPTNEFPSPCGACRQVIREFTNDCPVIFVNGLGETKVVQLSKLLPQAFGPDFL